MGGRGRPYSNNTNRGNKANKHATSYHSTPYPDSDKPKSLKRNRPNSDSDISQELKDLSNILDNLSNNKQLLKQATNIILDNPAVKNCILQELSTEVEELKAKTTILEDRLDELEQ